MSEIQHLSSAGVYNAPIDDKGPDLGFSLLNVIQEGGELASPVSSKVEYEQDAAIQAFKKFQRLQCAKLTEEEKEQAYGEFMIYNVLQDESTQKADEDILCHKDSQIYSMLQTDVGMIVDEEINRLLKERITGSETYLAEEQLEQKMKWLKEAKRIKQEQEKSAYEKLGMKKLGEMLVQPKQLQEEIIRNEVMKGKESYKSYFKLINPLG